MSFVIAAGTALLWLIFGLAILEALARRGYFPVRAIANILSPAPAAAAG